VFGALMELVRRPGIVPVLVFILIFKLPDAAMGFMVKPFWVDAGFTAAQIGLVSVNIGLALSIAGGITGGWITDRIGILHALWILGLVQAASNLGYWAAALALPRPRRACRSPRRTRRSCTRRPRSNRSPGGSARPRSSRS
jgi:PAT family beta-lactamase induction signal transducer AmpG